MDKKKEIKGFNKFLKDSEIIRDLKDAKKNLNETFKKESKLIKSYKNKRADSLALFLKKEFIAFIKKVENKIKKLKK